MVLNKLLAAIGVGTLMLSATAAQAITMYSDQAMWQVDVTTFQGTQSLPGADFSHPASIVLSGGSVLDNFSSAVEKRTVGPSWMTWPGTPGSNGTTVFYSMGATSVSMNFKPGVVLEAGLPAPVDAFGVFLEPNPLSPITMTLDIGGGNSLTQVVNGNGGALFFGWTGKGVTSITMSTAGDPTDDFAFGQFYEGHTNPIPEPETYALMLAGLGAIGFVARRRKPGNAA